MITEVTVPISDVRMRFARRCCSPCLSVGNVHLGLQVDGVGSRLLGGLDDVNRLIEILIVIGGHLGSGRRLRSFQATSVDFDAVTQSYGARSRT